MRRRLMARGGAAAFLAATCIIRAQSFVTLHGFSQLDGGTNPDRAVPGRLILPSNVLYGTSSAGGRAGNGCLFKLNLDGNGFTNFYDFSAAALDPSVSPPVATNADGAGPDEMVLVEGTLYGTASYGGAYGLGTVFKVGTNGTGFTPLHSFAGFNVLIDGAAPNDLTLVGGRLYGTTVSGVDGTVFSINPNGTQYTNLFTFTGAGDGAWPNGVTPVDNVLYGTAGGGGSGIYNGGTVFSINLDGSGFTPFYSFTNATGDSPQAGLIASGDTLYGTTSVGGNIGDNDAGWGTIFAIKTNGTGYVVLHAFSPPSGLIGLDKYFWSHCTNSDGAVPAAPLVLNGSTLYGTTYTGGNAGNGTIFAINTDGSGFINLYSFSGLSLNTNRDGANPRAGLILSGDSLYGRTFDGGPAGYGTLFSVSFPPQLSIVRYDTNIVVSWPSAYAGFDYSKYRVQGTTNLTAPVWTAISQGPTLVDGMNLVTNPITSYQQFFRLIR